MFGISGAELIVILLVALVVLGPDRLPVVARKAGQVLGELRKVSAGFEAEMRTAMYQQEPPRQPATTPTVTSGGHHDDGSVPDLAASSTDPDPADAPDEPA